ncbi:MAG: dephospho-CoA kinase [Phycisphaeraceae bacterium]|nr:dephospho-CoA kinase [Phycisphaeraceae bacterium]
MTKWGDAEGRSAPEGERTLVSLRPSALSIVLRSVVPIAALGVLALALAWPAARGGVPGVAVAAGWTVLAVGGLKLLWETAVWASRRYTLTDRRVVRVSGVLRRVTVEARLERVQHVVLYRSLGERLLGLGTIGFATAGTDTIEVAWVMIGRPREMWVKAKEAIDMRTGGTPVPPPVPPVESKVLVLGLAGGIGAGKSAVAAEFARRGCVVIDSDVEAKAALDRPEVREQLRRWWGERVIGAGGRVDRAAVAAIVFEDESQRRRLESLVHPLVRARRAELVREAASRGAEVVVVDAPLLFEAGVDAECDAVVFVDAPREVRLERVRASRGWDEAEVDRRERAQMPLEEKRRRSRYGIVNAGLPTDLGPQVEGVLRRARADFGGVGGGSGEEVSV